MFKASNEQSAIIQQIITGKENVVVKAGPGSGKTATAIEAMKLLPESKSVCFVCFNKKIAEENATKVPNRNIQVSTLNSIGWCACLKGLNKKGYQRVDEYKTQNILQSHLDGKWDKEAKAFKFSNVENEKTYYKTVGAVKQLVSLAKANAVYVADKSALEEIVDTYQIDVKIEYDDFMNLALAIYTKCINDTSRLDWDDQIFMTMKNNYPLPKFDYVFVDEFQDLNKVQFDLILQLDKKQNQVKMNTGEHNNDYSR